MAQIGHTAKVTPLLGGCCLLSPLVALDGLEHDDRDLPRGLLAVVPEPWIDVGVLLVEAFVVLAVDHLRARLELLAFHLDGHDRVRLEVVVPGGVGGGAARGGDDHDSVLVARVDDRIFSILPGLCTLGGEDQDVASLEWPAGGLAAMGTQVGDEVAIEVMKAAAHKALIPHQETTYSDFASRSYRTRQFSVNRCDERSETCACRSPSSHRSDGVWRGANFD